MSLKIGPFFIGSDHPVFIIAEAGVNHDGDMEKAKELIDAAKNSGADAIKFQSFVAERVIRKNAPKAKYQDRNIGKEISQFEMLKKLELGQAQARMLKKHAESKGIIFFSTAYDSVVVDELEEIEVACHKLASIEVVNHLLIRKVAKTGKPLILSVGMANEREVAEAAAVFYGELLLTENFDSNLILLQCNTNYPASPEDQHLRAMETLRKYSNIVGFSDHTIGSTASIGAVALGAKVIERHFTLNKHDPGPDHKASMEPGEFRDFVNDIRAIEKALGSPQICPRGGELENIVGMRRSICSACHIAEGTVITEDMIAVKRPGNGLYATDQNLSKIIGKKAVRNINYDENILLDDVG